MTRHALALLLLVAGCDPGFDDEPLDGGQALQPVSNYADVERVSARDPCRRRERRGWHHSVQHCAEMLPPERMTGVWISAFEVSAFHPGATSIAQIAESRQDIFELEIDPARVVRLTHHPMQGGRLYAVALTFVGRRTRIPSIGCDRSRFYTIVVDRIERADDLDTSQMPPASWRVPRPYPPSPAGSALRRLEDEMIASCRARDRERD